MSKDGIPVFCGGTPPTTDDCQVYSFPDDDWDPTGPMTMARKYARSVVLSNGSFSVFGGKDIANVPTDKTEILRPNQYDFSPSVDMPGTRYSLCVVRLESGEKTR